MTAVRRYLKEFLSDSRVVEMPRLLWWLVLRLAILTTRPHHTARAYQKVWRKQGSPLLTICQQLQRKLQQNLAQIGKQNSPTEAFKVELGMRYGNPSIAVALRKLQAAGMRKLLVLPLYPQYSATTTASALDAVFAELSKWRWLPAVRMIDHYHDHHGYLRALANSVRQYQKLHGSSEMLLMSFHGIPQSYFQAGDPYHCECWKTARCLAEQLGLADNAWRVSFQSRFGTKPWLQPYTDQTLIELARGRVRDVQVICPGFSADCLETLEEIAMQNRDIFQQAGGRNYDYIPCLNDSNDHIHALSELIVENTHNWQGLAPELDCATRKKRALAMGADA